MQHWLCILMFVCTVTIANATEPSDQGEYYSMAGRLYGPDNYCEFGGGIPEHYVEICERIRPRSRQAIDAQARKSTRWKRITADNGAAFAIDLGNIGRPEGNIVAARMCQIDADGRQCVGGDIWIVSAKLFWFDCRGHYSDLTTGHTNGWQVAPPNSIIGRASDLACDPANQPSTPAR